MAREIIRPEYGQPLIFKLGFDPVQVDGIRGQQWRYFVNDDEAMLYLDQPAHEAIQATGASPGKEICLRKERVGRATHWAADIVEDEPVAFAEFPGEKPTAILHPHEIASYARMQARQQAQAQPSEPDWVRQPEPAAKPKRSTAAKVNGHAHSNGNGNGHQAPAAPPPAPVKEMPPHRPGAKLLAMALFAAIDAAKLAEDYAKQQGLQVAFTSEDIRTMANTLRMEERKEGR